MRGAPFDGNTCIPQFSFVEILEKCVTNSHELQFVPATKTPTTLDWKVEEPYLEMTMQV